MRRRTDHGCWLFANADDANLMLGKIPLDEVGANRESPMTPVTKYLPRIVDQSR